MLKIPLRWGFWPGHRWRSLQRSSDMYLFRVVSAFWVYRSKTLSASTH